MINRVLTFDLKKPEIVDGEVKPGATSQQVQALQGSFNHLYGIDGMLSAGLRYGVLPASFRDVKDAGVIQGARTHALYFGFRDQETVPRFGKDERHQDWAKKFYRDIRVNNTFFQYESLVASPHFGVERLLTFDLADGTSPNQVQELRAFFQNLKDNKDVRPATLEKLAGTVPEALQPTARQYGLVLRFENTGAASRFDIDPRQAALLNMIYSPVYKRQTFFQNAA